MHVSQAANSVCSASYRELLSSGDEGLAVGLVQGDLPSEDLVVSSQTGVLRVENNLFL